MVDQDVESIENSTENTRKKILPDRPNRGSRMKSLQGKDLEGENELYDLIFAEKSSDEDFAPSQTEFSNDESLEGGANDEEGTLNDQEEGEEQEEVEEKLISKRVKKAKRAGIEEEIVDLDQLDLDKIDELEDMRDRGVNIKQDFEFDEGESDEFSEENQKRKKNRKSKKKTAKPVILVQNDEAVENSYSNVGAGVKSDNNIYKKEKEFLKRKSYRKSFIDDEEKEFTQKKSVNKIGFNKRRVTGRAVLIPPKKIFKNKNVTFRNSFEIMYINKSVLEQPIESEDNISLGKEDYLESEGEDIMKYNEESYKLNLEEENINTKNIIKKYKKQEKSETAPVRYTFMQEKMSQKELLLEAIFTEYYNIQSLQEMQRLEDLNKKEMSAPGKKQFAEYVRIVKKLPQDVNAEEKEKEKEEKEDINKIENTAEVIETTPNKTHITPNKTQIAPIPTVQHENLVTFSNPAIYEKIFENFNHKVEPPKEKKFSQCVVTGQPAKYFDPLTKQYYANKEAFKVIRERYFQKEEDSLLFRIQTLSDLASQKKEKLKKIVLTEGNANKDNVTNQNQNIINMIYKYGILKNEGTDLEKKVISHRIYNRNRENCVDSGMLMAANKKVLVISKKIFKDKYSSRTSNALLDEEKF